MLKKILRGGYRRFVHTWNVLNYFILPNLCRSVRYSHASLPRVEQRFILSGLGRIRIGHNCSFGYKMGGFHYGGSVELQARTSDAEITIGNNVATNNNLVVCSSGKVTIGDNTLIGQHVCIMDFEAHGSNPNQRRQVGTVGTVSIGENVWIGNNVTILKNSVIGDNSIVATGAVVSGIFPNNVILGGGYPLKLLK